VDDMAFHSTIALKRDDECHYDRSPYPCLAMLEVMNDSNHPLRSSLDRSKDPSL
jgi:hypothetical protein